MLREFWPHINFPLEFQKCMGAYQLENDYHFTKIIYNNQYVHT